MTQRETTTSQLMILRGMEGYSQADMDSLEQLRSTDAVALAQDINALVEAGLMASEFGETFVSDAGGRLVWEA